MIPCTVPSTITWLDKVHLENIFQKSSSPQRNIRNASFSPNRQLNDYQNMQTSIVNLSHTLKNHHAQELQNKKEKERKKADKIFDNLSEVQKTTIKMITIKPDQTDADINDLEATSTMRVLLEQGTSIKVQAQLQHEYSRRRYIFSLPSGMCTSIKQGILASHIPTSTASLLSVVPMRTKRTRWIM